MVQFSDDELGMSSQITRRDVLNGMLVGAGAAAISALPGGDAHASHGGGVPYPPRQTRIVGQTERARRVGHAATFGGAEFGKPRSLKQRYDLIVVGGGVSGLAAAHFYRKAYGKGARILILEALADFGGHQHRNEFLVDGRTLLSHGGVVNLDSPDTWEQPSLTLMQDLGIDFEKLARGVDTAYYSSRGLGTGYFFPAESFAGGDTLVRRDPEESLESFVERLPLSPEGKAGILRVETTTKDYFPRLSDDEKKRKLARMSYAEYLSKHVGVNDETLKYYQRRTHGLWGVGIDAVPAGDCWGVGLPGFEGLELEPTPYKGMGRTPVMSLTTKDENLYYFPDGGATVSRLLVSKLVPGVFGGRQTMSSIITARADYHKLDLPENRVRIRLSAMATKVRHRDDDSGLVDVTYARRGEAFQVSARHVVMACWNSVSSYIVEGLPAKQAEAMRYGTKVPLVYARVALRDWRSWKRAGISRITPYDTFWDSCSLVTPTDQGDYHSPRRAGAPIVVNLSKTPNEPGLPTTHNQHKAGRRQLLEISFREFEREIRDLLQRTLGPSGFRAARDIQAITVNRWAHGYAYEYNSLADPVIFKPVENQPFVVARQPLGAITIANSDAEAFGYSHAAIDQAARAVNELVSGGARALVPGA
jgi:spermidine dehydrogenase